MKQVVITKEIKAAIQRTPYRSTDGQLGSAKVIARLFYPRGDNSFLILEGAHEAGEKWDGDHVFGLCKHDGHDYEFGTFSLSELLATKAKVRWSFGDFEVGIERDICVGVQKKTVIEVIGKSDHAIPDFLCKPENDPAKVKAIGDKIKAERVKVEKIDETANGCTIAAVKPNAAPVVIATIKHGFTESAAMKRDKRKLTDEPDVGSWNPAQWKALTADNLHNYAQLLVAKWAAKNATAERKEFDLLCDDYAYIHVEGEAEMTTELLSFRHELFDELRERVTRVFGADKWAECAACL